MKPSPDGIEPPGFLDADPRPPQPELMKITTIMLCLALLTVCSSAFAGAAPGAPVEPHQLKNLHLVVIDPGHGGSNRGCLGVDGTWEKQVTLAIAKRVARVLRKETTSEVRMTRTGDEDLGLRERARMANRWGADVFLSLHVNADIHGVGEGVETWFLSAGGSDAEAQHLVEKEEGRHSHTNLHAPLAGAVTDIIADTELRVAQAASSVLAELVVDGMESQTLARNRGVKQAAFGVLKEAKMPAIVIEAGFFSHEHQGVDLMTDVYQEAVARGIVDGLIAYDARLGGEAPSRAPRTASVDAP